jgi:hypothetical protein
MSNMLRRLTSRGLQVMATLFTAACGQFPEPAVEEPLLSSWVAERYRADLEAAEIVKINSYSDALDKPIYVALKDNVPIYFPYQRDRRLVVFVVEMKSGRPIVRYDGLSVEDLPQTKEAMAWVIEESIRRAKTHNNARDLERRSG